MCDAIQFSIRNGLLTIDFYSWHINTSSSPFLLDQHWHAIRLERRQTNILLHIDQHIIQQRLPWHTKNISSTLTLWMIFNQSKDILIEDLRLYDQSMVTQSIGNIPWTYRSWKPLNAISLTNDDMSYLEMPFADILCQDCPLESIDFQFRTSQTTGLLLFAHMYMDHDQYR
jgi:hypothetical protein